MSAATRHRNPDRNPGSHRSWERANAAGLGAHAVTFPAAVLPFFSSAGTVPPIPQTEKVLKAGAGRGSKGARPPRLCAQPPQGGRRAQTHNAHVRRCARGRAHRLRVLNAPGDRTQTPRPQRDRGARALSDPGGRAMQGHSPPRAEAGFQLR